MKAHWAAVMALVLAGAACQEQVLLGTQPDLARPDARPPHPPVSSLRFSQAGTAPLGAAPIAVAMADLDGDGLADVVLAGSDGLYLLRTRAGGMLGPVVRLAPLAAPTALALADLNGDGRVDFAVAAGTQVSVFWGDGRGGTAGHVQAALGGAAALAVGSVDGGGSTAVAVAVPGGIGRLRVRGDGTLDALPGILPCPAAEALIAADLDGDGHADLAAAGGDPPAVCVLRGRGDGTFAPPQMMETYAPPGALRSLDRQGHGRPDLALAVRGGATVMVLPNQGGGAFGSGKLASIYPVGAQPVDLVVADFNADGRPDLASADQGGQDVSVLLSGMDAAQRFATGNAPAALAAGDVDGDGLPDLVVAEGAGPSLLLLRNTSQ